MDKDQLNIDKLSQEDLSRLYKVKKTINEMMEDRGYDKNPDSNMTRDEFIQKLSQQLKLNGIFSKTDPDNPESSIRTYFEYIPDLKLNMNTISQFVSMMMSIPKISSGILIIAGKLTQQAKQRIEEINTQIRVEVFTEGELVVNITKHELVPKHILLNPEEKSELLKRYNIKQSQLPKIYVTDPVAKYHGLKRGDVVKIVRVSETAGKYITYRIAC
jgi:DNA-directed RNA polymerase I, II, and III subunit RPABC1